MIRQIIKINTDRCDGCGICITACEEGALQIIDGKAVLIKDDYCDGLGNCLPVCPQDAIRFETREAAEFDEKAVEEHLKNFQNLPQEKNTNYDIYEQFSMPTDSHLFSEDVLHDLDTGNVNSIIRDLSQFHTEEPRILETPSTKIQARNNIHDKIATQSTNEKPDTVQDIPTNNLNVVSDNTRINLNIPNHEKIYDVFATPEMQNALSIPDTLLSNMNTIIEELEVTQEPPAFEIALENSIATQQETPILLTAQSLNSEFSTLESEFAHLDAELQNIDEELTHIDTRIDEEIAHIDKEIALIANFNEINNGINIFEKQIVENSNSIETDTEVFKNINPKIVDKTTFQPLSLENKILNQENIIPEKVLAEKCIQKKQENIPQEKECEQNTKIQVQNNKPITIQQKSCTHSIQNITKIAEKEYGNTQLRQWPVQMKLVPIQASYFNNAHLLIAADCCAYAYADFHNKFMHNKVTIIACPKLDNCDYTSKIIDILSSNNIKSITVTRMEVPCCSRMEKMVIEAIKQTFEKTGKFLPWQSITISTKGNIID